MSELTKRQKIFIQEAINTQALEFGNFILKSGRESPYFFNASKLIAKGNLSLITDAFEEIFNNASIKIDQIFGPAYKGTILGSFLGLRLQKNNNEISLCFNRKEIKDHGEKGVFIGAKPTGRVLIIDDVLSAGTAATESIKLIKNANATPMALIVGLNRQEKGSGQESAAIELEAKFNIRVYSIIDLDDLIVYLEEENKMRELESMQAYREKWGA